MLKFKAGLLQLLVAIVVALWVSGGFPTYVTPLLAKLDPRDKPYKPDILWVNHFVLDPHKIDVKMGDWYFTVPVNRADTIFQENKYQPGEIDGFDFVGNWPGFHARTRETIKDFRGLTHKVIVVIVSKSCPVRSTKPSPIVCTSKRMMELAYKSLLRQTGPGIGGQDVFERSKFPQFTAPDLPGYTLVGFVDRSRRDGRTLKNEQDLNVYRRTDKNGLVDFAKCLRKTKGYSCTHRFVWRDDFQVSVRYAVQYRSDWLAIKKAVLASLDEMATPASAYVPPTPPWCDRIPFPRPPELRVPGSIAKSC